MAKEKRGKKTASEGSKRKEDRIHHILGHLLIEGRVRVSELAAELRVTEVTIREDLGWLAEAVGLVKFRGGAQVGVRGSSRGLYHARSKECPDEKDLIAAYAVAHHIRDSEDLLLDSGTTLEAFVRHLSFYPRSGIRAISQAANFALHFLNCPDSRYLQLGGCFDSGTVLFDDGHEDFETKHYFHQANDAFFEGHCTGTPYKAVVAATGFTCEKGLTSKSPVAIRYKRRIIAAAAEVIVLIDHHKFALDVGKTVTFCGLRADPWLPPNSSKPATVIVDWPSKDVPRELEQFAASKRVEHVELVANVKDEFPHIRVYKTSIFNDIETASTKTRK